MCLSGPKVVVNVRLMTGSLVIDDAGGDWSTMIFAPSPSDQHIDDENQTLTKFKTFQVGISFDVFSFFISQFFFLSALADKKSA